MDEIWIFNHYATSQYERKMGRHYWFAENLQSKGYKAKVFCANTFHGNSAKKIDTGNKKYFEKTVEQIPFVFVKTRKTLGNGLDRVLNMILFYLNLFPVTKNQAKKNDIPDVILASSVHPLTMLAGIQIAKKMNIPCICEVRDLWPEAIFQFTGIRENGLLGRILTRGEHWIYKNADALIFTKEGDTDYIKEKKWDLEQGGDIDLSKAYYINNGVDLNQYNQLMTENILEDPDLKNDKFTVTYVGSLRPVNDVANIIKAAKLLKEKTDIEFLIYGQGTEEDNLREMIKEEKLDNVKIKGYVDKKYIPYILSRSSVNLLNYSRTQYNWSRGNSSNKLFEYMASAKPIISNVQMGYSIIEKYSCGLELEDGGPEDLAESILDIKEMDQKDYEKLGRNAKQGAKNFDFEILTDKLIGVIEGVL